MCLIPDKAATDKFVAEHTEPFVAYKVLQLAVYGPRLVSMFMNTQVNPGILVGVDNHGEAVKPGYYNFATSALNKLKFGIHVCLTVEEAEHILASTDRDYDEINVIVEVICDPKHLVAVGCWDSYASVDHPPDVIKPEQAIFSEITVTKEAYDKTLNEAIKQKKVFADNISNLRINLSGLK